MGHMRSSTYIGCIFALSAGASLVTSAAYATPDNYAFGFSGYDGGETLTINGSTVISTNGVQGWVSSGAGNTGGPGGNTNYIAGTCCGGAGNVYSNYFVFNVSGVTSPVTSASLTISPYSITQDFTYVLHDASAFVGSLDTGAVSPDPVLYSQLGTGPILGSFAVLAAESYGSPLTFNLNSTGVSNLNALLGKGGAEFAISGTVLGQAGATGGVPEPATWAMMLLGFASLGYMGVRKAQKPSVA